MPGRLFREEQFSFFEEAVNMFYTACFDVLREKEYAMNEQLKRSLLDVCVLAAIKNEDSYGYKINKDMKPYVELSESTLHIILKRLETANMLTVKRVEHNGRLRYLSPKAIRAA